MLNWWFERNMLVCFFRLLTENGFGFAFITKFSKIFVWTSPGAFDVLKVDVLTMLTSPGALEILCQVFQNGLWRIFLLPCTKVVQVAVFFRENQFINPFLKLTLKKWIVQDLLTARELVEVWRWKESFLKPQKFSSFLEWLKLFSLIFGIVVVVFAGWWWSEELLQRNRFQIGQHVLDTDSWNHSDVATKDLWRRFSWRFNGWSRSWFKIMLWSWGPFVCQETNLFIRVMKLVCKCWICLRRNLV